ncbi:hypothetical protein NC652_038626 [Populus alba x Populus x berolinensis]|nr:hypothetical protein NC652_038626 [Populus alba x Populus x berolinensis]
MQDDTLTGTLSSVDVATKENLENLVKVGEELLKKPVSRVNLATGVFEPINKMTNEEALRKLAKLLSREKHLREAKSADDTLTGTLSSVDVATKENLENLVKVGEELLIKPVSRVNLATGVFEPINKMTNEEALRKLAKLLSREKHLREAKSAVGN